MLNSTAVAELSSVGSFPKETFAFVTIVHPTSIILGIVSNIINISVFAKIGFKDSVNVSFFSLALSDLGYLLCDSATITCFALGTSPLSQHLPFNVFDFGVLFARYETTIFDFSILMTAYIAVTRCCCVAMALRFRGVFTVSRTVVTIIILFCVNLVLKLPVQISERMQWAFDPARNRTTLVRWRPENFDQVLKMHDIVNQNILPYTTAIITVSCMFVLIYHLVVASKKRRAMTLVAYKDARPARLSEGAKETEQVSHDCLPADGSLSAMERPISVSSRSNVTESQGILHDFANSKPSCSSSNMNESAVSDVHVQVDVNIETSETGRQVDLPRPYSGTVSPSTATGMKIPGNSSKVFDVDNSSCGKVSNGTDVDPHSKVVSDSSTVISSCAEIRHNRTSQANLLSKKDLQVIKVVILVSATFFVYVLYFASKGLARLINPEIDYRKRYSALYRLLTYIGYTISHVNAGVNSFIYFHFNSRYREVFLASFRIRSRA